MKKYLINLILLLTLTLTGCDEVQIMKEEVDPSKLTPYSNTELNDGIYYVKQGTKFYQTLTPQGSASQISYSINESRICPVLMESLIPTYYNNEVLAYYSSVDTINTLVNERMKDLGYSIGVYNCIYHDTGIECSKGGCIVKDSDAYNYFHELNAETITIVAIDGIAITQDNFDVNGGVITGLEKDKEYVVSYYEGTQYHEDIIKADCLMLQSYEIYYDDNIEKTTNGYLEYSIPSDYENGYYNINGKGICKYLNYAKGEQNDAEQDLNIPYYKTEDEKLAASSYQYAVNIPNRVKDLSIIVEYLDNSEYFTEDMIQGLVKSPTGTYYNMSVNTKKNKIILDMDEASAGKWTVNIMPKILTIKDVSVNSNTIDEEYTLNQQDITFDNDYENVIFYVEYTGEGTVFGSIVGEDGSTWEMEVRQTRESNNEIRTFLYYEAPIVLKGDYAVKIYHNPIKTTIGKLITDYNYEEIIDTIVIEG